MIPPLRELQRWTRQRLGEIRDVAGVDMAALKLLSKYVQEQKANAYGFGESLLSNHNNDHHNSNNKGIDVWAGLGLGSDVAAAIEGRRGGGGRRS
jgi:hypothetical protein